MKLTVIKWLADSSIGILGRSIELIFRSILCLMPLGLYMLLLQKRSKASKVSSILTYTNDRSVWQHVFPGFILISIEPDELTNFLTKVHNSLQTWVDKNKYILALIFMILIVGLMVLSYMRGGNL